MPFVDGHYLNTGEYCAGDYKNSKIPRAAGGGHIGGELVFVRSQEGTGNEPALVSAVSVHPRTPDHSGGHPDSDLPVGH